MVKVLDVGDGFNTLAYGVVASHVEVPIVEVDSASFDFTAKLAIGVRP